MNGSPYDFGCLFLRESSQFVQRNLIKLRELNEVFNWQLALAEFVHAVSDLTAMEDLGDICLR